MSDQNFKELMAKVITRVLRESTQIEEDPALAGSNHARVVRDVEFYRAGLKGEVPDAWGEVFKTEVVDFYNTKSLEMDPEYREYLRLCKKFS